MHTPPMTHAIRIPPHAQSKKSSLPC
jgi:hypothetical protein